MRRSWFVVACSLFGFAALGCATVVSSELQEMRLSVSPPDASATIYRLNGEKVVGPLKVSEGVFQLPRPADRLPYLFVYSHPGYCPAYRIGRVISRAGARETRKLLPITLIGWMLASTIDSQTGGEYAIDAYSVRASLAEGEACSEP